MPEGYNQERMAANQKMMKEHALSDAARSAEAQEAGEAEKWEKHPSMGVEFDLAEDNEKNNSNAAAVEKLKEDIDYLYPPDKPTGELPN